MQCNEFKLHIAASGRLKLSGAAFASFQLCAGTHPNQHRHSFLAPTHQSPAPRSPARYMAHLVQMNPPSKQVNPPSWQRHSYHLHMMQIPLMLNLRYLASIPSLTRYPFYFQLAQAFAWLPWNTTQLYPPQYLSTYYKVVTLNSDQNRHSTDGPTSRAAEGGRSTPIYSSYSNREGLHNAPAQRVLQRS